MSTTTNPDDCLALEVVRHYDRWIGTPSPSGVHCLLRGAEARVMMTRSRVPAWTLWGPLNDPEFDRPIVALTGHPTLTIRWPTALELIHYSLLEAMADLERRMDAWISSRGRTCADEIRLWDLGSSVPEHFSALARRPPMYLGVNSSWLLHCYLTGMDRGGDWLGLPTLPELRPLIDRIESESYRSWGSRFGGYRMSEGGPAGVLSWAGIEPQA